MPVVTLIEDAYARRQKLVEPASDDVLPPAVHDAVRKRILITGAGGFLGGRAVDMLRDRYGFDTVPLVREPRSAARLARSAGFAAATHPAWWIVALLGFAVAALGCLSTTAWAQATARRTAERLEEPDVRDLDRGRTAGEPAGGAVGAR